jgi:hypothetical protein
MVSGTASYVLPCLYNFKYVEIGNGDLFGHSDMALHKNVIEDKIERILNGDHLRKSDSVVAFKRVFTVRAESTSQLLRLSMKHINIMCIEFPRDWCDLMLSAYHRFSIESKLKLEAIGLCESSRNSRNSLKKRKIKLEAFKLFTSEEREHETTTPNVKNVVS